MIHSEDNARVEVKITNDGDLFVFCPECRGVWQMSLNTVHKPKEVRPITYGGGGINLDLGSSESAIQMRTAMPKEDIARELFPEAFK